MIPPHKSEQIKIIPTKSEEFFQKLTKESPYVAGDDGGLIDGNKIEWLNPKLLKEGAEFFQRNSFSINIAHIAALLFGFSFKNLTTVLLRTGRFSGVDNSMARYLETELHILTWYELDMLEDLEKKNGFKDIQRVRKMHALALKQSLQSPVKLFENVPEQSKKEDLIEAMKKDLACFSNPESPMELVTYHPTVLMSQFDMAMTQYGFVGLVYLFPEILGIKDKRGMEGFVHLWAVLGRLVGLQDKYNIALHADRELFVNIFKTIGMASLMQSDLTAVVLQESFAVALSRLMGFISMRSTLYFALRGAKTILPAYEGDNIYKLLDWWDIVCLRVIQFTLFLMYHFDFCRAAINKLMAVLNKYNRNRFSGVKKVKGKKINKMNVNGNQQKLDLNQIA